MELSKLLIEIEDKEILDEQLKRLTPELSKILNTKFGKFLKVFGNLSRKDFKVIDSVLKTEPRKIVVINKSGNEFSKDIKNADELADLLKYGKIGPADKGRLSLDILRNGGKISPELKKSIIESWAKKPNVINKYNTLNHAQMGAKLKDVGIVDDLTRKDMINTFISHNPNSAVAKEAKMWGKKMSSASVPPTQTKGGMSRNKKIGTIGGSAAGAVGIGALTDELVSKSQPKVGGIGRNALKALKLKWVWGLIKIGLLTVGGTLVVRYFRKKYKKITGKNIDDDPIGLPTCMFELLHREGAILSSTAQEDGDPIINLTKTGSEEYDNVGGLKLYIDHTLTTADDKRKGTWECKLQSETLEEHQTLSDIFENMLLNEELLLIERDVKTGRMDNAIDAAVNYFKDDVEKRDLKTLYRRIKKLENRTYDGKPALLSIMNKYNENTGNDLINDIQQNFKGLDFTQDNYRKSVLSLLQSVESQSGNVISGPLENIISITWNNADATSGDATTDELTNEPTQCTDLPFKYGCNNPMIKEIQVCLGMEKEYQTGNFGPITYERLTTAKYDLSNGITKEIYDNVMMKCGKVFEKPLEKVNPISPPQSIKPITPQKVPQIDKLKPMGISNIEPKTIPQIDKLKPNVTGDIQNKVNQPTITQNEKTFDNRADYENYLRSIGQPIPPTTRELLRKKEEQDKKNRL